MGCNACLLKNIRKFCQYIFNVQRPVMMLRLPGPGYRSGDLRKKPVRVRLERSEGFLYAVIPEIAAWNAGFLEF